MALRGPFLLLAPVTVGGSGTVKLSSGIYVRGEYGVLLVLTATAFGGAAPASLTPQVANVDVDAQYEDASGLATSSPGIAVNNFLKAGQAYYVDFANAASGGVAWAALGAFLRCKVTTGAAVGDTIAGFGIRAYLGVRPGDYAGARVARNIVSVPHCSLAADGTITATKLDSLTGIPAGAVVTGNAALAGGANGGGVLVSKVNYSVAPSASTSPAPGRLSLSSLPAPSGAVADITLTFTW